MGSARSGLERSGSRIHAKRGALVPVDVGPQFDDLAAARHPQTVPVSVPMGRRDDFGDPLRCDVAVVDGDGVALVFDACSRNLASALHATRPPRFPGRVLRRARHRCGGDCRRVRSARSRGCPHTRGQADRPAPGYPPDRGRSVSQQGTAPPVSPAPLPCHRQASPHRDPRRFPTACRRSRGR